MRAMLLAAGLGERMRPLTNQVPKPLLRAGPLSLIEYHLYRLAHAGFEEVVINIAYRAQQIKTALGDGREYGVRVIYSDEGEVPLETAGGIVHALPLLGSTPFWLINADIWTDYPLHKYTLDEGVLAHLIMVPNPVHHRQGDFVLAQGRLSDDTGERLTYSGMGIYDPQLFNELQPGRRPLAPVLRQAMKQQQVSGECYRGHWWDIGTPQRLQELDRWLSVGEGANLDYPVNRP